MTTEHTFTIGPRQTVDRASHPTLGEGRAVYDNGPAFFQPDVGDPVAALSIGLGGWSSKPVARSWITMTTPDGVTVDLDTTKRESGDHHRRAWHPHHGAGWFVMLGRNVPKAIAARFDPDDGKPFEILIEVMSVGTPEYAKRSARARTRAIKMTPEEEQWKTYELTNGETIAFRDYPPGEEPKREERPVPKPPRKVTAPAPVTTSATMPAWMTSGFPPPDATRAEVDTWHRIHGSRA